MMDNNNSPWANYRQGWKIFLANWKIVFVVYGMNLLLAFVAMGPLSSALGDAFEYSPLQEAFVSSFDYTLIMDFIHQYGNSVELSIEVMSSFVILYLLWSIFYTGGYMALIQNSNNKQTRQQFWSGGAHYFFRFMRLTFYTLALHGVALFILGLLFNMGGTSPLILDSEEILITKLKYLIALFMLILFLVGIFKDIAKIHISASHRRFISKANLTALTRTFKRSSVALGILNVFFLLLGGLLYVLLKKIVGDHLLPSIIIAQLFLFYRIAYKFVRLASFFKQEKLNVSF